MVCSIFFLGPKCCRIIFFSTFASHDIFFLKFKYYFAYDWLKAHSEFSVAVNRFSIIRSYGYDLENENQRPKA